MTGKTAASSQTGPAPSHPDPAWLIRDPSQHALLSHLAVVDSADSLFLLRQTGLTEDALARRLARLKARGCIASRADSPSQPMLHLTRTGRTAHNTIQRWRFKAAALVLLSALPFSGC